MDTTSSFTLFPRLPPEPRRLVWEHSIPPLRDLRMGRFNEAKRLINSTTIVSVRPPVILYVCHESRQIALRHGCFVLQDEDDDRYPYVTMDKTMGVIPLDTRCRVWIDRNIRAVYLRFVPASLARLRSLPSSIRAIASPPGSCSQTIRDFLARELSNGHFSSLETVYYSVSDIIYDGQPPAQLAKDDPAASARLDAVRDISFLHGEADVAVLDLHDRDDSARASVWTEAAMHMARARFMTSPSWIIICHRTSACYLKNLRTYWETNSTPLRSRAAWEEQRRQMEEREAPPGSKRKVRFPELKPALVFGKSEPAAYLGSRGPEGQHERASGLLFTAPRHIHLIATRVPAHEYQRLHTPSHCERVCGTEEREVRDEEP
ncbi:hypothetical protein ACRALDRAFT_1081460 [Sodiomyces alcalophilus JCM 7366]|uniref:uncharacterized protein n=1 Tax=Sodiomyces alcalophilus JCM 7366 TaxID=591952 RepID=UPI0039B3DE14